MDINDADLMDGDDNQPMTRVLVTTTYSMDSIVFAITKFSIERVYLLIDRKPDEVQQKTISAIKDSYANVLEIKEKKIEKYDIVSIAKDIADLIDAISNKDEIFVNVTPGRKTQALGVVFACYARHMRIKKLFYVADEEPKEMITLPLLSFELTESQKDILRHIEKYEHLAEMSVELDTSRAMLYRNIKDLKAKGLIEENGGLKLTDAGKIAKL